MLKWSHEHAQFESYTKLFLMAYCFLSQLPSEALPVVAGRGEPLDAQAVLWKTDTELVLDLRVRKKTNGTEDPVTCPLHVLGPLVDSCPAGLRLFLG